MGCIDEHQEGSDGGDLRQFRYFIAVAEERHFGRAAAHLHIAQSGLSQQILKLERSVGVQLLVRDRRGVEITDAGEAFLDCARLTLEMADRAVESAKAAERGKTGLLRVGTTVIGMPPMGSVSCRPSESGSRTWRWSSLPD